MMKSAEMATNIAVHYSSLAFTSGHEIVVVVVDVGVSLATTSTSPVRKREECFYIRIKCYITCEQCVVPVGTIENDNCC